MGPDNDLSRKVVTDLWIRVLQKHEVFLYKEGAYCWKFRDIRLALREILELGNDSLYWSAFAKHDPHGAKQLNFIGQLRPRTHLWIGGWYVNAFLATGHTHPLIEALYHYLQAVVYSFVANPSSGPFEAEESTESEKRDEQLKQWEYAEAILVTACYDLRKLLRLSIGVLPEFGWGPGGGFTKGIKELADGLNALLTGGERL